VNRHPVMVLWAAVVASHLGHDWSTSLSMASAVASMNAKAKGRALGIYADEPERPVDPASSIGLLGRRVPTMQTRAGLRATDPNGLPIHARAVYTSLESAFGESFPHVYAALTSLASTVQPETFRLEDNRRAYDMYLNFRPDVPPGQQGWGAKGVLDLGALQQAVAHLRQQTDVAHQVKAEPDQVDPSVSAGAVQVKAEPDLAGPSGSSGTVQVKAEPGAGARATTTVRVKSEPDDGDR